MSIDKETMDFLDGITSGVKADNKPQFEFTRIRNVHVPDKAYSSAGIDFYVPTFDDSFIEDLKERSILGSPNIVFNEDEKGKYFTVLPHNRVNIPSGVKVCLNVSGTALIAFNKSGISTKFGLDVGACVVDEDYLGEVHLSLKNDSPETVKIYEGQKIVQFLYLPLVKPCTIGEISNEEYAKYYTERGEGAFGSSDSKK